MASLDQTNRNALRRLTVTILLVVGVIAFGIAGFMVIAGYTAIEAIYQTVITLSTVGFREVNKLDSAGMIFTVILIVLGVSLVMFGISGLGKRIVQGELQEALRRRKMSKRINELADHVIVVGYGSVGRTVVEELRKQGEEFVVVERDGEKHDILDEEEILYVNGTAIDERVLRKAQIDRARALITTISSEAENVYITLTGRGMNERLTIIARAGFEGGEQKLRLAGADDVVSLHVLGGQRMAAAIKGDRSE